MQKTLIKPQCLQSWCWAAVAEFLHAHYKTGGTGVDQEAIASRALDCDCSGACKKPADHDCNQQNGLCKVLKDEELLVEQVAVKSGFKAHLKKVSGQVPGRAVCVRVPKNKGHFIAITDILSTRSDVFLEIMDPAGGFLRYMLVDRLIAHGYPCWGKPQILYYTGAKKVRKIECKEEDRVGSRTFFSREIWSRGMTLVEGKLVSLLKRGCADPAPKVAAQSLQRVLELEADTLQPFQDRKIQIEPCIPLLSIQSTLMGKMPGLEICGGGAYPLLDKEDGTPLGLIELGKKSGSPVFDTLTLAPDSAGDRYVTAILKAMGTGSDSNKVLVRVLERHEHAVIDLNPGVPAGGRVSRLSDRFGFDEEGLALEELAEVLVEKMG